LFPTSSGATSKRRSRRGTAVSLTTTVSATACASSASRLAHASRLALMSIVAVPLAHPTRTPETSTAHALPPPRPPPPAPPPGLPIAAGPRRRLLQRRGGGRPTRRRILHGLEAECCHKARRASLLDTPAEDLHLVGHDVHPGSRSHRVVGRQQAQLRA